MPRRKQAHPLHIDTVEELTTLLENAAHSGTQSDDSGGDEHVCGKCRAEFIELGDFLYHKRFCTRRRPVLIVAEDSSDDLIQDGKDSPTFRSNSSLELTDDPDREAISQKYPREIPGSPESGELPSLVVTKPGQSYIGSTDRASLELDGVQKGTDAALNLTYNPVMKRNLNDLCLPQIPLMQPLTDTNVTLEALQNTRVAVAQHGSQVSHLAALQSALCTLQQQQLVQLQVIQQLQAHLVGVSGSSNTLTSVTGPLTSLMGTVALTPPQSSDSSAGVLALTTSAPSLPIDGASAQTASCTTASHGMTTTATTSASLLPGSSTTSQPLRADSQLPPPHEPNTLELLQRHTEQALQNTMAGGSFLINGLSGIGNTSDILRFCKSKPLVETKTSTTTDDSFFRHRCRFCGKVFGSDSALQIHIRSHTGERPFKCNVCGNRFSTKGNLKVHFQRHKSKYPHIRMNPHPVPEHLDSLHPPLEPPDNSIQDDSPSTSTAGTPLGPPTLVPTQTPTSSLLLQDPHAVPPHPQNVETGSRPRSASPNEGSNLSDATEASGEVYGSDENGDKDGEVPKCEEDMDDDSLTPSPRPPHLTHYTDEGKDPDRRNVMEEEEQKPLVGVSNSLVPLCPPYISTTAPPTFPSFFQHSSFAPSIPISSLCFPPVSATPTITTAVSSCGRQGENVSRSGGNATEANGGESVALTSTDPTFYQDLLPKPGSNDNSWESLMEVTKPSETSKLQQLVDNIEHKLSDPNQCVICQRVLSCKSALQMHYRTHTGERPFKCKICGRAFTTKGNLKTHMGVHRVKPPLRVLHQCPVCHKQFTNSLVLQQHIRMHTGEPTDMLPEQIMANEVKPTPLLPTAFSRPLMPTMQPPQPQQQQPPMSISSPPGITASTPPIPGPEPCSTPNKAPPDGPPTTSSPIQAGTPTAPSGSVIKTTSKEGSRVEGEECSSTPPSSREDATPTPVTTTTPASIRSASPSMDRPIVTTAAYSPMYTASLVALENHVKAVTTNIPQPLPFSPFGMGLAMGGYLRYDDPNFLNRSQPKDLTVSREKSPAPPPPYSPSPTASRAGSDGSADERSTPGSMVKAESPLSVNGGGGGTPSSNIISSKSDSGALDLTPKTNVLSSSPTPEMVKMFTTPLSGLPFPPTPGRINTTCQVCFKTFACYSALEIHYRSHTKERPFKCDLCERGFSTKGNMKQHMLTHKIRDLPPQLFTQTSNESSASYPAVSSTPCSTPTSNTPTTASSPSFATSSIPAVAASLGNTEDVPRSPTPLAEDQDATKRPASESGVMLPLPKRPPGIPKHFCHICQKPFSSASALQIHMRTHTGDKPFKCTVCGRAFTTKGNLKVHMGTHMWNNGTSRRGRRMSLELPPLPLTPGKPGEYPIHPRPDLYFPYLPPAYMNGMAPPPKMNEISVIQTAGVTTNGNISTPSALTSAVSLVTTSSTLSFGNNTMTSDHDSDGDAEDIGGGGFRAAEKAENRKSQSPPRTSALSSPVHPVLSPAASDRGATWGWKIACNICSKICSSSAELESHVKCHYNPEAKETACSPPASENIAS